MSHRAYFTLSFALMTLLAGLITVNVWLTAETMDGLWIGIVRLLVVPSGLVTLWAALHVPAAWFARYR